MDIIQCKELSHEEKVFENPAYISVMVSSRVSFCVVVTASE